MKETGVKTYNLICPVMPYITEIDSIMDRIASCSDTVWVDYWQMHYRKQKTGNAKVELMS